MVFPYVFFFCIFLSTIKSSVQATHRRIIHFLRFFFIWFRIFRSAPDDDLNSVLFKSQCLDILSQFFFTNLGDGLNFLVWMHFFRYFVSTQRFRIFLIFLSKFRRWLNSLVQIFWFRTKRCLISVYTIFWIPIFSFF